MTLTDAERFLLDVMGYGKIIDAVEAQTDGEKIQIDLGNTLIGSMIHPQSHKYIPEVHRAAVGYTFNLVEDSPISKEERSAFEYFVEALSFGRRQTKDEVHRNVETAIIQGGLSPDDLQFVRPVSHSFIVSYRLDDLRFHISGTVATNNSRYTHLYLNLSDNQLASKVNDAVRQYKATSVR